MVKDRFQVRKIVLPLLVTGFFGWIFLFLQMAGVAGGDAGDLVTAAVLRGIPHPPGYPLYTLLGWLLNQLPLGFSATYRVGWLSSVPAALGLGIFFLIVRKLTKNFLIALIAVFSLGFNYLYWFQAEIQEVFALHLLLLMVSLYLVVLWFEKKRKLLVYALALVTGLEFAHHHTYVLILPALAYLFLVNPKTRIKKTLWNRKFILTITLMLLTGASFYLYVPWAAAAKPMINWGQTDGLKGLVRLIARAEYGTFSYSGGQTFSFRRGVLALFGFAYFLYQELGLIGSGLAATGFYQQLKKTSGFFKFCLIWFLVAGPFFQFYAGWPVGNWFSLGTTERFYLLVYPVVFVWLGFGLELSYRLLTRFLRKLPGLSPVARKVFPGMLLALFGLYPGWLVANNFHKVDFRGFSDFDQYGRQLLDSCPPGSLFLARGDKDAYASRYAYFVLGERPDLGILNLVSNREMLVINLRGNYQEKPVFRAEEGEEGLFWQELKIYLENNQLDFCASGEVNRLADWNYYHRGLAHVYTSKPAPDSQAVFVENQRLWQKYDWEKFSNDNPKRETYFYEDLVRDYRDNALKIALYFMSKEDFEATRYWIDIAGKIDPEYESIVRLRFLVAVTDKDCDTAEGVLKSDPEVLEGSGNWEYLEALYEQNCLGQPTKFEELMERVKTGEYIF